MTAQVRLLAAEERLVLQAVKAGAASGAGIRRATGLGIGASVRAPVGLLDQGLIRQAPDVVRRR